MVRVLIIATLLLIIFIDIKKMFIPNILNLLLLILAFYYRGINPEMIESGILGMGVYSVPFIFIYGYLSDFLKKEVLGFGDIKLMLALGYILGYSSFYQVYLFFVFSFLISTVIGIIIGIGRGNFSSPIPFSPFIVFTFLYYWSSELV